MAAARKLDALNQMFPRKGAAPEPTAPTLADTAPSRTQRAPSREGKLHISAWLEPDYKISLRAIQMKDPQKSLQDLFSEALNDLFAKHNVPTVRKD
jgi:hypothetical protein